MGVVTANDGYLLSRVAYLALVRWHIGVRDLSCCCSEYFNGYFNKCIIQVNISKHFRFLSCGVETDEEQIFVVSSATTQKGAKKGFQSKFNIDRPNVEL